MKLKMILLCLSLLLILGCQVWQNAWGAAGQTRGFSVIAITDTITPTVTKTPGSTPTNTSTPSLDPRTATALFKKQQFTQNAANALATKQEKSVITTSTASAKNAQATVNAINNDATAQVKSTNAAATAQAKSANSTATAKANPGYATEIAKYRNIDPNELVTDPTRHINESVVIKGKVFYVINNTDFLIWLDGVSYQAIYISMVNPSRDIYENADVTIYGIVAGEACGTNTSGLDVCQPKIVGVFYER